jgi:hypothetical protein
MLRISELFGQFYGGANRNIHGTFPVNRVLLPVFGRPTMIFAPIGMLNGLQTH